MTIVNLPYTLKAGDRIRAAEVQANDEALRDTANNLDSANVVPASLTDAKLVSPTNLVWRPVFWDYGFLRGDIEATAAGVYIPFLNSQSILSTSIQMYGTKIFWPPQDVAVAGKTTKFRIVVTCTRNSMGTTQDHTAALYPITAISGTNNMTFTRGAAVITTPTYSPAINSYAIARSTTPAALANGAHVIGVTIPNAYASGLVTGHHFTIEMRHE